MIKGIGTDIVDNNRIRAIIIRHGNRFLRKIFTEAEIELCRGKADQAVHFAARWAAKEAFYKALPSSCQSVSSWKSIQIISIDKSGKPHIEICSDMLKASLQREKVENMQLSMSHEQLFCVAFVVLE
jgi:holo-[acyl-carrier protein] synthase